MTLSEPLWERLVDLMYLVNVVMWIARQGVNWWMYGWKDTYIYVYIYTIVEKDNSVCY